MSLFGKVEAEIEIKASAYKFYEVNSKRLAEVPKLGPNFIQSVDLVEGEWDKRALSCAGILSSVSQSIFVDHVL